MRAERRGPFEGYNELDSLIALVGESAVDERRGHRVHGQPRGGV